ncbi:olfactory receptor 6F1-like [Melanotaenia boesemani]|uniref:olfactory receptor 6F1-like n=1 Tax=Melanotaenia boesemani TaxID=1250792 RepID=UPI001C058A1C|nr:olfactory receptor 6F1-like [Melanotaenia boesemani]
MDNVSVVKFFIFTGINETTDYRIAVFSLTLLYYCLILFLNVSLVVIVVLDENLHEPMYILLCSVCFNAIYGTTGFYPKFLLDLLSLSQEISYEWCLLQTFVIHSFACCELSILAVMAYDRYLAICHPLHYHSLMTKKRLCQLVAFSWVTPFFVLSVSIIQTSRLELCGSKMKRILCVNWIIVRLACSHSNTTAITIASYATIVIYVSHGLFIIWTYKHIIKTCTKSKDVRVKFMQTCLPHLISLITFLVVMVFDLMYMRFGFTDLPQNLQNFITIEFLLFPPLMNPLIYGFILNKIRNRILSLVYIKRL